MYPTSLFYTYYLLQFGYKPSDRNGRTLSICKPLYGKKYIYIACIPLHPFFKYETFISTSEYY